MDGYARQSDYVTCADNWSNKSRRRATTGTGRTRHLKTVNRRFLNGFREGTQVLII